MAWPLAMLLLAGCVNAGLCENISIQYVIIHATSNASSSSSSHPALNVTQEPLLTYVSSPRPRFITEQTVTPMVHGPSSALSNYTPSSSAIRPSSAPPFRGSEPFLSVTYEHQIPGMPGKDYPIHSSIAPNKFDCRQYKNNGYYADVISGCQIIHICQEDGTHESFLCPNGTIFNQQYLVCDWWFNVDCSKSWTYYNVNVNFKKDQHASHDLQEELAHVYESEDHVIEDSAEISEYNEDFEGEDDKDPK